MTPFVSIIIPFYNEYESLKELVPRLNHAISALNVETEIIFVDDGSTDKSVEAIEKIESKYTLIQLDSKSGQTACYKKSFEIARGKYIIRMDSDLQDSPEDLPKFLVYMNQDADLIMGLREARKHRRILRLASAIYDILIMLLFNSPLHSNSGSFVCFKAKYVKNIPWVKNDHRYIPLIAMQRGAVEVREVFVRHSKRQFGESNYKPFKKLVFGIPEVFRFLFRIKRGYYSL